MKFDGGIFLADEFSTFHLQLHNFQFGYQMEVTIGFSSSNRSRNHLGGISDDRLNWLYGGKKKLSENRSPGHPIMM